MYCRTLPTLFALPTIEGGGTRQGMGENKPSSCLEYTKMPSNSDARCYFSIKQLLKHHL
jgi:hypothetical protein